MNQDFEKYQAEKKYLLDAYCTCGGEFKVFVDGNDCYGICPNCGKKSYQLTCKKCETGFSFGEDNKVINKIAGNWVCPECNEINQGLPDLVVKLYRNEEIPEEIKKEDGGSDSLLRYVLFAILVVFVIFSFYIEFIK